MDAAIKAKVDKWLSGNFDEDTKAYIQDALANNPDDLVEGFYKNLEKYETLSRV